VDGYLDIQTELHLSCIERSFRLIAANPWEKFFPFLLCKARNLSLEDKQPLLQDFVSATVSIHCLNKLQPGIEVYFQDQLYLQVVVASRAGKDGWYKSQTRYPGGGQNQFLSQNEYYPTDCRAGACPACQMRGLAEREISIIT
jgi:hypothetical protein